MPQFYVKPVMLMPGIQEVEADNQWWGKAPLVGYEVGSDSEDCRAAVRSEISFTKRLRGIQRDRMKATMMRATQRLRGAGVH